MRLEACQQLNFDGFEILGTKMPKYLKRIDSTDTFCYKGVVFEQG
jgi:hypothetical protein